MSKDYINNIWALSENYLDLSNNYYSVVSSGRDKKTLYKSEEKSSLFLKILHITSFALIVPPLLSYLFSKGCRRFFSYVNCKTSLKPIIKTSNCEGIATANCFETQQWRKKLIQAAQHNIVISGNYCGGKSFDEILNCIILRIKEVPQLKVVIIAHPKFITKTNKSLLKKLQEESKNNFTLVHSPDSYFGIKKITNHTKCTVIDYGKYFIQGGSGIKDNFSGEGIIQNGGESLNNKKQVTQDDLILNQKKSKKLSFSDDIFIKPAEKNQKKKEPISFIESFLPNNFRDQDFVFRSTEKGAVGKKMFREALFLAFKWEEFNKNRSLSSDSLDLDKLSPKDPLFKTYPALSEKDNSTLNLQSNESGNALNQLLKTKVPDDLLTVNTRDVLGFRNQKISNIAVRTFFTGPEDNGSDFEKVLIERIHSAKQRISIDQMYFQPSKKLMQEIINAANRGVKVTVVTALGGRRNSSGEKFFGPRNKYNLNTLFYSVTNKKNINIYTYSQEKNGLHKKVVVIDDSVLAGSSNMGTKSLKLTGDHEMNFEATSKEFADETLKIIQEDISKSKKLNKISLSLSDRILSFIHNTGSRIWG